MAKREMDEKELQELRELDHLNRTIEEHMARMEEEQRKREAEREQIQREREARLEQIRIQQEKRMNAILRMIATICIYGTMAMALMVLAYTKTIMWWLGISVALGLSVCGAFRAGMLWRESRI